MAKPKTDSTPPPKEPSGSHTTRDLLTLLVIVAGAVAAFVRIETRVNALDPAKIKEVQDRAIQQLEAKYQDSSRLLGDSTFAPPVGTILPYAAEASHVPKTGKWLVCDGAPVSRTEYKELFDTLGVSWGEGDKTATFNLPDLRGQFLRGADQRAKDALDPAAPRPVGSIQTDAMPEHIHDVSALRVAGGLMTGDQHKILYVNTGGRRDKLSAKKEEYLTFWNHGDGERDTVQRHGGDTTVETIGLLGSLGGVQQKQGEARPTNRAVQYLIRVKP